MKRKFKLWWSSLLLISIKWIIVSHLNSLNTNRTTTKNLEIQVLAWNRHKNVAGLNWLLGSQPSPSWQRDLRFSRIVIWLNYLHVSHDHVLRNLLETSKHIHIFISEKHTIKYYHSLKNGYLVNDIKIDKIHV